MDKFQGVRFTSFASVQGIIDYYKSIGKTTLAIVTSESKGYVPWNADIVQVGNEPDVQSTYMSPSDYAALWNLYRNTYPGFTMFSAGLASGGLNAVNYLDMALPKMQRKPDAIAIHPYNKTASDAAGDFDLMWNAFQIPVVATEWYRPADQCWDFQAMLNGPDGRSKVWNSWFCYSDQMETPFGLLDVNGNPKDVAGSLISSPYI